MTDSAFRIPHGALLLGVLLIGCSKTPVTVHDQPVAHWLEELKRPDPAARKKAVKALGHAAVADRKAMAGVIGALKDDDASVRDEAVLALLNIGPPADEALTALREMMNDDPDETVREHAFKAVARIEGASP